MMSVAGIFDTKARKTTAIAKPTQRKKLGKQNGGRYCDHYRRCNQFLSDYLTGGGIAKGNTYRKVWFAIIATTSTGV